MDVGTIAGADMDLMKVAGSNVSKLAQLQKAKAAARGANAEKIDQTAHEFEAQFITQMLENMFSTVETDPVLGGGESEKIYQSFLNDEYGKIIARTGGIGVADHVKREMIRLQEVE